MTSPEVVALIVAVAAVVCVAIVCGTVVKVAGIRGRKYVN